MGRALVREVACQTILPSEHDDGHPVHSMEGITTQHPTGYVCRICEGIAVVDLDGEYLCAHHAIEAMEAVEIDLRDEEPTVAVSKNDSRLNA